MSKTYIAANLRRMVFDRSNGICEYCLIPESLALSAHQVDHIIAEKHGGQTIGDNLALSCSFCNQAKGSDVGSIDSETGDYVRLYHPRRDRWSEHFQLNGETGEIIGESPIAKVTIRLLQMNRHTSVIERQILNQANAIVIPTSDH